MVLDILEDLELNESDLSASAISFARDAQAKKNELTQKLAEDKEEVYYKLLKNGMLRSSVLSDAYARLEDTYEAEVDALGDELGFQIDFLGPAGGAGGEDEEYSYPYNPDYSLDAAGRYYAVYNYYMTMTDPDVRFALFQADTLAPSYVAEFYATLYDRLYSYVKNQ